MSDGVSIVIPLCGHDRLRLLAATLASMRRCTGVDQIIVAESGAAPCGLDVAREYGADYVFACRSGPFDKASVVNAGSALASGRELLWSDADFLLEPGFVVRAQQEMRACGADFFFPYSRVHYLGEADSDEVLASRRRAPDCSPIRVMMPGECPGGMGMVRAEFVRRHGGMIEGFRGWGGEDHAWLHKAKLLGRVEASPHPDQVIWHLYHRDSGSHSRTAQNEAIRRNRHYAGNVALLKRVWAVGSAEEFLRLYPAPAHAAPPWAATTRLAFVAVAATADAPAAVLARAWARRIHDLYGAEARVVVAGAVDPEALRGLAADAVAGFADDAPACRALIAALDGRPSVVVTGAVEPARLERIGSAGPLILARTSAQVAEWTARGLSVWHRPWEESEDAQGAAAPPLVQPLSHLLGSARLWRIRIELDRAALADAALDRPHFWYVGLHDAEAAEVLRQDLSGAELRRVLARGEQRIVIERAIAAVRPPHSWTVWPADRRGRWLDKLSGPVGPDCLS